MLGACKHRPVCPRFLPIQQIPCRSRQGISHSAVLHRFGDADLEHRQDVIDHTAHRQAQGNASLLHGALGVQNAAGIVEAVERRRHINAEAGDAGGVVLFGSGDDFRRERCQPSFS